MPNIRAQIVGPLGDKAPSQLPGDDVGIYIQASNGQTVTVTKRQMLARYAIETGSRAQRRTKTMNWLRQQIVDALGAAQISLASLITDFDENDGTPTSLEVS